MAVETPTSYKDSFWTQLASATEQKLDLPPGLLVGVLTRGERSNADQVSEAGAKTPFQIIPATRKAAIDKYGIDPYLSPENAADVAGRLLKDSLDRNKGNAAAAVGEYVGGTDRSNWGPTTRAYVKRVTGSLPADTPPAAAADPGAAPAADGPSTFDKLWGAANAPQPNQVANILKAYQGGQMAPEDKRAFEADVKSGKLMLPQGASLMPEGMVAQGNIDMSARPRVKNADGSISTVRSLGINVDGQEVLVPTVSDDGRIMTNDEAIDTYRRTGRHLGKFTTPDASNAFAQQLHESEASKLDAGSGSTGAPLPPGVVEAYRMGKITGADRDQLLADVKAGTVTAPAGSHLDLEARFPNRDYKAAQIPGVAGVQKDEQGRPFIDTTPNAPTTIGQQITGAGEAALSGLTGAAAYPAAVATAGANLVSAAANKLAGGPPLQDDIAANANAMGDALTYHPRTDTGQSMTQAVGEALQPLAGLAPAEAGMLHSGAAPIVQAVKGAARATPAAIADVVGAVKSGAGAVADATGAAVDRLRGKTPEATATPGTMGSAGAAGTDIAAQRVATAEALPVPMTLTRGEATRDYAQQKFEKEMAKHPDLGAPLRDNAALKNKQIAQNFDALIDRTGAERVSDLEAGRYIVDDVLTNAASLSKKKYDSLYKRADASGETLAPVDISPVLDYLNSQPGGLPSTALPDAAKAYAVKLGLAVADDEGALKATPNVNLRDAEAWRTEINKATGADPTDIRQATIVKKTLDGQTAGAGGELYRDSRKARERHAQLFENNAVVSDLLSTKPGTSDRSVALEGVVDRIVKTGSREDLGMFRRTLDVSDQHAGVRPGTTGPGARAWREVQAATLRKIAEDAGATGKSATRDEHGNPIISAAGLHKAVEALDKTGKLDFILGKQWAQTVRDLDEITANIKTSPPGAVNHSNTASALAAVFDLMLSAGTGLPAPVASFANIALKHRKDTLTRARVQDALGSARTPVPVRTNP